MEHRNSWNEHRNPVRYCSKCGSILNPNDKAKSHDFGLMRTDKEGYPRPLCKNDAYFFASKYIEEHLEELINKK